MRCAHRVSWVIHNGGIKEPKKMVMHRCDNPGCVNPLHLRLGTCSENTRDMVNKGRQVVRVRVSLDTTSMMHIRARSGFIVNISGHYVGYFKTVEEALIARNSSVNATHPSLEPSSMKFIVKLSGFTVVLPGRRYSRYFPTLAEAKEARNANYRE